MASLRDLMLARCFGGRLEGYAALCIALRLCRVGGIPQDRPNTRKLHLAIYHFGVYFWVSRTKNITSNGCCDSDSISLTSTAPPTYVFCYNIENESKECLQHNMSVCVQCTIAKERSEVK